MSILGKYIEQEEEQDLKYKIPAVFRENQKDMSLKKSVMISTVIHPLAIFLLWLFIFIAGLLGITFVVFNKPEAKPRDIEFVLVDKEQTPINKNTRYRADRNSRAGGKHDPKRKVSMPKAGGGAPAVSQQPKPQQPKAQKPVQQPKNTQVQPKKTNKTNTNKGKSEAGPAKVQAPTPAPRPSATPTAPKVTEKPKSDFTIPVPKATNIPNIGSPSGTGPIVSPSGSGTGGGNSKGSTSSGNGSGLSFAPTGSATGKNTRTGGTGSGSSTGSGSGKGNVGNPGPGNPNGTPGIDAIKEPDFGPYMRELQNRIKRNWEPPKGEESRRVVLLFTIARDGRLISVNVSKSSGLAAADNAAINAVKLTAPFKPLPAEYKKNSVDIQFTFDYNVFGAKKF